MITRFVKLSIQSSYQEDFEKIFSESKEIIRGFEGCAEVKLFQDNKDPGVYFTVSRWNKEEDLDAYRSSEIFGGIWKRTKLLFSAPAEAWTVSEIS